MAIVSVLDVEFRNDYRKLTREKRRNVRSQYLKWKANPNAKSFAGKFLQDKQDRYYRVKLPDGFRAVAIVDGNYYLWIFVGTHDDYLRLVQGLP